MAAWEAETSSFTLLLGSYVLILPLFKKRKTAFQYVSCVPILLSYLMEEILSTE